MSKPTASSTSDEQYKARPTQVSAAAQPAIRPAFMKAGTAFVMLGLLCAWAVIAVTVFAPGSMSREDHLIFVVRLGTIGLLSLFAGLAGWGLGSGASARAVLVVLILYVALLAGAATLYVNAAKILSLVPGL